jgi:signal transduction histidine kinase
MQLLGIAEIMLYVFAFILVLSERRQREQRLAYEKLTKELEYVNLQLNESMALSERLASEAERRRIAGEIHDSLGHDLTGLILTLEAGKRLTNHNLEVAKTHWDKALKAPIPCVIPMLTVCKFMLQQTRKRYPFPIMIMEPEQIRWKREMA